MRHKVPQFMTIVAILYSICAAEEKCYVFFPTTDRPQAIQDKLQSSLSGVTVTVFGRINDFNAKLELEPPDAIIAKPALISQFNNYEVTLTGLRKGKAEETYVVLSIGAPVDLQTIGAETTIGVIDVLGRAGMKSFISQFFKTEPKLKRVTKVEDLLPLLSFNMAAGVLIEDIFVNYFKSTSQLDFKTTSLPQTQSKIIALGIRKNGKADKTTAALKKADKALCSVFEVDSWK